MMLLKLNTNREGGEIDDILLLFEIKREILRVLYDVPKPYIVDVGNY
jgi:hypothetical protein